MKKRVFLALFCISFLAGCTESPPGFSVKSAAPGFVRIGSGETRVVIEGSGFESGIQLRFVKKGTDEDAAVRVNQLRVLDNQHLEATISLEPGAEPGVLDILITFDQKTYRGTELFGIASKP